MKKAYIYIILASVLWGSSGLFVNKLAPMGISTLNMTLLRSITGVVCIGAYLLITEIKAFAVSPKKLALYFGSGLGFFFTGTFYFLSMQMTSVSTAVVLMYTAPVFVMIYSVAFLGEKMTSLKLVSLGVMFAGCLFVSGIFGTFRFDLLGIFVGLMSGITYSAYNIFTKIQMKNNCDPYGATFYCFLFTALISVSVSKPWKMLKIIEEKPSVLILLVLCGVCTCVLPYLFYTLALRELSAGTASSLAIVEPMAATLFSITLLGEKLTFLCAFGVILIISAVFMLSRVKEN